MRVLSSCPASGLAVLLSTLLLGACGYTTESSNQDITFLSPSAHDAKCYVYANKVKYQVYPPQTVNIKKSEEDMKVECNAPGNRYIELEVPAKLETKAVWGTPVGMAWDYASSSLYSYPDVIAIDFSNEELTPNSLPKHNNEDIRQPEDYDLEEFLPSEPRLNSDKNKEFYPPVRTDRSQIDWNAQDDAVDSGVAAQDQQDEVIEKGDLQTVIDKMRDTPTEDLMQDGSVEETAQSEEGTSSAVTGADTAVTSEELVGAAVTPASDSVAKAPQEGASVLDAPSQADVVSEVVDTLPAPASQDTGDSVPVDVSGVPVELVPGE